MRCEKIMKTNVQCLSPDATAVDAARRMRDENIGFLPICNTEGRVLGTVTDRDLVLRAVAEGKGGDTRVSDLMTTEVVSCSPQESLGAAEKLMAENHKSRIVCVDDERKPVGVISLSDIAKHERGTRATRTLRAVTEREA
jgi:CBS domain-containing protein